MNFAADAAPAGPQLHLARNASPAGAVSPTRGRRPLFGAIKTSFGDLNNAHPFAHIRTNLGGRHAGAVLLATSGRAGLWPRRAAGFHLQDQERQSGGSVQRIKGRYVFLRASRRQAGAVSEDAEDEVALYQWSEPAGGARRARLRTDFAVPQCKYFLHH